MRPRTHFWIDDDLSPAMWTDTQVGRIFTETNEQQEVIRLRAWVMGPYAELQNQMTEQEIGRTVLDTLARIRPATKGKLALEKVISWGRNPHACGAFSHYLAGDVQKFGSHTGTQEGRLHFIGEHTAPEASGMEAAIISANRCLEEITTQPGL